MVSCENSSDRKVLAAIVLARTDSSRFPRKCFATLGGISVIENVYRRLSGIEGIDRVLLATTARSCDDELADCFLALGGLVYRHPGSETDDVAGRLMAAATELGAEYVLRVNGDSPFPIPSLIQAGIHLLDSSPDLVTNLIPRSYPYGTSVEWIRVAMLRELLPSLTPREREHPTSRFYSLPGEFRICCLPAMEPSCHELVLTVDHPEDLSRLESVLARCDSGGTTIDLPELVAAATPSRAAVAG